MDPSNHVETIRLLDSVEILMSDGAVLVADLWLPPGQGPWPMLLHRTPYRREGAFGSQLISALEFQTAVRQGFGLLVQDTRGRYGSGGDFHPFQNEALDGAETVAWLAAQPFCNGQVAMFGASYCGATQVLTAARRPPHLLAIAPQLTTARHGETWMYRGGALELAFVLLWLIEALGPEDLPRRSPGLEPELAARAAGLLRRLQADHARAFERLPLLDMELQELAPYMADWMDPLNIRTAVDDRTALTRLSECEAAMLVIGGFNDIFLEGSIELFSVAIGRKSSRGMDRLILGPWSHGNPSDWQGDEWLGYGASTAELTGEQLSFFNDVFAGRQPASAPVRYFRSGSNTWHAAQNWPPSGVEPLILYLDGRDGSLQPRPCCEAWSRTYTANPLDPVPTVGGASYLPGLLFGRNSGPKDQAEIEIRQDVLIFTSAPLEEDTDISGHVEATFWIQSTAETADWTVRLCEVDEDGRSLSRVDGIVRWSRPSQTTHIPNTDIPNEVTISVGSISHLFRKGHSIRVQIASSNFPRFDRNPQSRAPSTLARTDELVLANQTLFGDPTCISRITLPLVRSSIVSAANLSEIEHPNNAPQRGHF